MISVCITTYNGEKYIGKQISSILQQINAGDEVIISDDGSTDSTLKIIESFADKRIRILNHERNNKYPAYSFYKITKNFENALNASRGDIIFLADQDDIWERNKVETVKSVMGNNWLVLHDCNVIDAEDNVLFNSYFRINDSRQGFIKNIINSSYLGCCMAFKRELLDTAMPFPEKPVPHDIWLGLLAEWKKKAIFIDDKLVQYRRHGRNMSTSGGHSSFSLKMKVLYRYLLIEAFLKKYRFI